ncbi:MAG: class I SAM-dependent methyltransferase [Deltaproteobacteria bacterium]|nr:class I SAM-dependent methyltransferase [Deltaproteobacteria bacterium]MBI3295061.1 class I SAM-dependent methyltransferase [Deltaproteobacteria bacterium]
MKKQAHKSIKARVRTVLKRFRGVGFKALNPSRKRYECPICQYQGPFQDAHDPTGLRKDAMCPSCSALERHRTFWLTLNDLPERARFCEMSLLHFAPEPELGDRLRRLFGHYTSADLDAPGVDYHVDLTKLPFENESYDMVIASHVLEHIREDRLALHHIKRILKPGGIAILQVPVLGEKTVEYPEPNPKEWFHVRSPGEDYFHRYTAQFSRVEKFRSSQFDTRYQPYIYENRAEWPADYRLRPTLSGVRHDDIVPVCYVER